MNFTTIRPVIVILCLSMTLLIGLVGCAIVHARSSTQPVIDPPQNVRLEAGYLHPEVGPPDPYIEISWDPLPSNVRITYIELLDEDGKGFDPGQLFSPPPKGHISWYSWKYSLEHSGCLVTETSLTLTGSCLKRFPPFYNPTGADFPPGFLNPPGPEPHRYEVRVGSAEKTALWYVVQAWSPMKAVYLPGKPGQPTPTPTPWEPTPTPIQTDILHKDLMLILDELRLIRAELAKTSQGTGN